MRARQSFRFVTRNPPRKPDNIVFGMIDYSSLDTPHLLRRRVQLEAELGTINRELLNRGNPANSYGESQQLRRTAELLNSSGSLDNSA